MQDIKKLINKKVAEHTGIITQITSDIEVMLKKAELLRIEAAKDPTKKQDLMVASATIMTLKDRIMFHKASAGALQDLLQELQ